MIEFVRIKFVNSIGVLVVSFGRVVRDEDVLEEEMEEGDFLFKERFYSLYVWFVVFKFLDVWKKLW